MIKCTIKKRKNIEEVTITGHADYADYGQDIVCSAVSMLSFAIGNKIMLLGYESSVIITDNKFEFINPGTSSDVNLLFETLTEGLEMVENEYSNHIKIREV